MDKVSRELKDYDAYISACEVDRGLLQFTCILDEDVALSSFICLKILENLLPHHPDTHIFISTGDVSWEADAGVFFVHETPNSSVSSAKEVIESKPNPNTNQILCSSLCPQTSKMPWLVGFNKLFNNNDGDDLYIPYEKIAEISNSRYKHSVQSSLIQLQERTSLLNSLKKFSLTQALTMVIVEGSAGSGKTNLVREMVNVSRELNIRTIVGSAGEDHKTTSFHAWFGVFKQLLLKSPTTTTTTTTNTNTNTNTNTTNNTTNNTNNTNITNEYNLTTDFSSDLNLIPLLNDILPTTHTIDLQGLNEMKGDGGRKRRLGLYSNMINENCSKESPLVIVLEDMQNADSLSWKLLHLLQSVCHDNLMVVITIANDSANHDFHVLRTNPDIVHLELKRFDQNAVKAIMSILSGRDEVSLQIARQCHKITNGLPSLLCQLCAYFNDIDILTSEKEDKVQIEKVLSALSSSSSSSSSQKLQIELANLRARYLSGEDIYLLCVLVAHEGRACSAEQILSFHDANDMVVVADIIGGGGGVATKTHVIVEKMNLCDTIVALDKLAEKRFLEAEGDSKFAIICESTCGELLMVHNANLITSLHAQIATKMEIHNERNSEIANHFLKGGDIEKAKQYLLFAGDDAIDYLCAPQEAIVLFTQLEQMVSGDSGYEHGHLQYMLGESCYHCGNLTAAKEQFLRAIKSFGRGERATTTQHNATQPYLTYSAQLQAPPTSEGKWERAGSSWSCMQSPRLSISGSATCCTMEA